MEVDNKSMDILKTLYESDLSQSEFNAMIGRSDLSQPNDILSFLMSEKLIDTHVVKAPDGEGGFVVDESSRYFSISRQGRAIVEQAKKESGEKIIDWVTNIIP